MYGNGLANTFANVEVSGPTTKGRQHQDKVFIGNKKNKQKKDVRGYRLRRVGEEREIHPLEGKERGMVHLAQDISGSCYDARLSWNSSRARVSTK